MNFNDIIVMTEKEYLDNAYLIESYILKNKNLLTEWCTSNYNLFNNNVYGNRKLFNIGIEILLKSNRKYNENDIKFIITYFAKETIKDITIDNIDINFSNNILLSDYSCAHYDKKKKEITFYLNKFKNMNDDDIYLVNGIMSIIEEIYRIKQQKDLKHCNEDFNIEDYAALLEYICSYEKGYYNNNYNKLIKENKAKKFALNKTVEYLNIFKPNILETIDDELKQLNNMYQYNINEGLEHRFKQLDSISTNIIEKNPYFVIEYPALYLGYELEGTPKTIETLKEDYECFLKAYPNKKDNIDNYYKILLEARTANEKTEPDIVEELYISNSIKEKIKNKLRLISR